MARTSANTDGKQDVGILESDACQVPIASPHTTLGEAQMLAFDAQAEILATQGNEFRRTRRGKRSRSRTPTGDEEPTVNVPVIDSAPRHFRSPSRAANLPGDSTASSIVPYGSSATSRVTSSSDVNWHDNSTKTNVPVLDSLASSIALPGILTKQTYSTPMTSNSVHFSEKTTLIKIKSYKPLLKR